MTDAGKLHRRSRRFSKVPAALTHDTRISDGAVRLYAHMHWRYGSNCQNFEGRRRMAEYLGVSEKTIGKRVRELEAAGWVIVVERDYNPKTGHYQTPFYHVFELRKEALRFRESYQPKDGEQLRPLPTAPKRKSRAGIGGRPVNSTEIASTGGTQVPPVTIGTQVPPAMGTQVPTIKKKTDSVYLEAGNDAAAAALTPEEQRPTIYALYEQNIGLLTPLIADSLKDAAATYPEVWIEDAIKEAVKYNARSWAYIDKILKRWERDGRTPLEKPETPKQTTYFEAAAPAEVTAVAPEDAARLLAEARASVNGGAV